MSTEVLYIGGWGRSGSTLLDRILGQIPGFVSLGEVRELWQRGCVEDRPCGCGSKFSSCPFWTEVGREAFGGWSHLDLDDVLRLRYSLDRPWSPAMLVAPKAWPGTDARLRAYLRVLESLYEAIRQVSGASVIVDSSKLPSHALLLKRIPSIDLRLVHLVRDSRGVAYSWQKQLASVVTNGEARYLERYSPVSASGRYLLYNELTRWVGKLGVPSIRLRYEDFVREPRLNLTRILRLAGAPVQDEDLKFLHDGEVDLEPNHTVDGNPMRFATGGVALRVDDEWRRRMSVSDRRVVTALTSPALAGYGYRLRGGRGPEPGPGSRHRPENRGRE